MIFIRKLFINVFAAFAFSALDILVVWFIADYKQLDQETLINYIFFTSFIFLAIFFMRMRDLFGSSITHFDTGDNAADYHLASSINSNLKGKPGDSSFKRNKRYFNLPLTMLLSFIITFGISLFLSLN